MEERVGSTKGVTSEINESKSQYNLKGSWREPCKCVTMLVKYISDFPTYTDFCTAPTYVLQILIYYRYF